MPIVDDYLLNSSSQFILGSIDEGRTDLALTQSAAASGRVRGFVTNADTGDRIGNATVKLRTQSGNPVAHTQTNSAGRYSLSRVLPGSYTINATLQGFDISNGKTFTILGNQIIEIDIALNPSAVTNTIFGIVFDLATGDPIDEANVVLIPSPGVTQNVFAVKSNANGEYILSGIPDGTRTLLAHISGYYLSSFIPVTLLGGSVINSDISLQPYQFPQATVNGYIKNQSGTAISEACVGLYRIDTQGIEILQQVTFTDTTGFYIFGRVAAGTYVVKSKSEKTAAAIG